MPHKAIFSANLDPASEAIFRTLEDKDKGKIQADIAFKADMFDTHPSLLLNGAQGFVAQVGTKWFRFKFRPSPNPIPGQTGYYELNITEIRPEPYP